MRLKVKIKGRLKDEKDPGSQLPEVEIVDAATGEPLHWVRKVSFDCEACDIPVLKIEVFDFDAEVECEAEATGVRPDVVLADLTSLVPAQRVHKRIRDPDAAAKAERARQILGDFKAMKAAEAEGRGPDSWRDRPPQL